MRRVRSDLTKNAAQVMRGSLGNFDQSVTSSTNCIRRPEVHNFVYQARTRQNKVVHFRPKNAIRAGSYGLVEITEAAPHHLRGILREVTSDPSHKVRIPVASM